MSDNLKDYLKGLEKCKEMLKIALSRNSDATQNTLRIAYVEGYLSAAESYLAAEPKDGK